MTTCTTIADLHEALGSIRSGRTVGLVPTMGAFHEGHLALIDAARAENDVLVVSIFVNPAQFGPGEDLARYPRDVERDAALAEAAGVDLVFAPSVGEIYPPGFQTWVEVEELGRDLEGSIRPGHFRGVATVCLKLFAIVRPDRAYFGQKDAQQLAVVEQMARDLALGVEIQALGTVRDTDGLALSSRNAYLSPAERGIALALPHALEAGREAHGAGRPPEAVTSAALAGAPGLAVDYVDLRRFNGRLVLSAAVRVGDHRLIDNIVLEGDSR